LALGQSGAEILKSPLEANLCRVQFAHGCGQPVLGEILRLHLTCLCDQRHRTYGRLLVPVGKHVEVGVCHAFAVERTCHSREAAVGQAAFVHEGAKRLSEWLVAQALHGCLPIVPG
jgi:hypothetical protein